MSLFRGKFRIHPLFFAAGILSAVTGTLLMFVAACLAALEHEYAHAFAAKRCGFVLDRVVLMPYGAMISGDISGIGKKQELAVLIAGPLANFATGVFFVALWWTFPETYPYTELAAAVSFSLFLVNLLPAYPLDGGRILRLLLSPLGNKRAKTVCTVISFLIAAGLLAVFVATCFSVPNWSILAFACFLAAGALGGGSYTRISFSPKRFDGGVEERRVAISASLPASAAIRFLREDKYLTLLLFEQGEFVGELSEEELIAGLSRGAYNEQLLRLLPSPL